MHRIYLLAFYKPVFTHSSLRSTQKRVACLLRQVFLQWILQGNKITQLCTIMFVVPIANKYLNFRIIWPQFKQEQAFALKCS
jgi:di/tricarboxylate transporter